MLVVLAATGVLRGLQDTRTPLVVAAIGAVANVVLNLVLVYGVGLGIAGSALGTVLAQTGMAAAFLAVVVRARPPRTARRCGPTGPASAAAASAGVPADRADPDLAGGAAARHLRRRAGRARCRRRAPGGLHDLEFLALTLDAVAIAGQAIVGRYLGAADVGGTRAATRRMVEWGVVVRRAARGASLLALRGRVRAAVHRGPGGAAAAAAVLVVAAVAQPVCGVVFALDGVLIGAGDGRATSRWAGVVTLLCFAPLALWVLATDGGLVWLWWAFDAFLLARLVTLVPRWRGGRWLVTGAALPGAAEAATVTPPTAPSIALAQQVGVPVVPGVLLDHVQHQRAQVDGRPRCRRGAG